MFTKAKQFLSSHKKVVLLAFLLLVLTVILYITTRPKQPEPPAGPTEVQIIEPSPLTFTPQPKPGEVSIGGTTIGISLFFDSLIDPASLDFEVFPPFELAPKILADYPDRIILAPTRPWQSGITYRITIKKGVRTEVTGRTLPEDVVLEYKVIEVPEEEISPYL